MSKINFKNYPPDDVVPGEVDTAKALAIVESNKLVVGTWVLDRKDGCTGVVKANFGDKIEVEWVGGVNTVMPIAELLITSAESFYDALKSYAEQNLRINTEQLWAIHMSIANGRDKMSFEALCDLETHLLIQDRVRLADDVSLDEVWEAIENAPGSVTAEAESDIFAQFEAEEQIAIGDAPACTAEIAEALEQSFVDPKVIEEKMSVVNALLASGRKIDALAEYRKSFGVSLQEAHSDIERLFQEVEASGSNEAGDGGPVGDSMPGVLAGDTDRVHCGSNPDGVGGSVNSGEVKTEAGLIDPETGEIIEPSFIMRKLGWNELPLLSQNPTPAELDAFEAKLDQVVDRELGHREKVARWTAANEKRCEPFNKAADFWEQNFVIPMSKQLAPHRLPKYKTGKKQGEYSNKTLRLASGCIRFHAGGGAHIHDQELIKAHILKEGVDKFKSINARQEIVYDSRKLLSALNKGVFKDFPGTGMKPSEPLATVKVISPARSGQQEDEE
ncbi:MAG: hypothetical protein KGI50_06230 [Patescibacteria group bacterium]|nr:hypothetical protein [Patescibacteria group bacterium]